MSSTHSTQVSASFTTLLRRVDADRWQKPFISNHSLPVPGWNVAMKRPRWISRVFLITLRVRTPDTISILGCLPRFLPLRWLKIANRNKTNADRYEWTKYLAPKCPNLHNHSPLLVALSEKNNAICLKMYSTESEKLERLFVASLPGLANIFMHGLLRPFSPIPNRWATNWNIPSGMCRAVVSKTLRRLKGSFGSELATIW